MNNLKLGNVDGTIIYEEFVDESNKKCTFWTFAKTIKKSNGDIKIYLLTKNKEIELRTENSKSTQSKDQTLDLFKSPNYFEHNLLQGKSADNVIKNQSSGYKHIQEKFNKPSFMQSFGFDSVSQKCKQQPSFMQTSSLSESPPNVTKRSTKTPSHAENQTRDAGSSEKSSSKKLKLSHGSKEQKHHQPLNKNFITYKNVKHNNVKYMIKILSEDCYDKEVANTDPEDIVRLYLGASVVSANDVEITDECLGRGGFGCVYKGQYNGSDVAVKSISLVQKHKYILREIWMVDKARHPNIVTFMAVCITQYHAHLVFELFEGHSLRKVLFNEEVKKDFKLNVVCKYGIIFQICKAMEFLQKIGIVHEDLKPENILVSKTLCTKICDFGLGKTLDMPNPMNTTQGSKTLHGTLRYMAYEILVLKQEPNFSSDIWSLGCVLYEILTEELVWPVDLMQPFASMILQRYIIENKVPDMEKLTATLQPVIKKCFNFNPDARCTAEELKFFFKQYL